MSGAAEASAARGVRMRGADGGNEKTPWIVPASLAERRSARGRPNCVPERRAYGRTPGEGGGAA
jgi:hypothetical protein